MREILASLDIGSNKIKLVVGEIIEDKLNILCALDGESRGIKKGIIIDSAETEYAIRKILKKAEEKLGLKITKTIVNVNEENASFHIGKGIVSVSSVDKEISHHDIVKVLQESTVGRIESAMELVSVVPIMFDVNERKTKEPSGMKASTLAVKSVVASVPKKDMYEIATSMEKTGLEIIDITLSSIGSYYAYKNEITDTQTGVIVDVGHEVTKIAVVNKGIIINNFVLGYGGKNVDNDLSFIYKIKDAESKNLKEEFARAHTKNASKDEIRTIVNTSGESIEVNQYEITEIVASRVNEILEMAKKEIPYLTKKELSFITFTGGLTELKDFDLAIEYVFGRLGKVGKIQIVGARDNKFAVCIGMIKFFDYKLKLRDKEYSIVDEEELDTLHQENVKEKSNETVLSKVLGLFFDN